MFESQVRQYFSSFWREREIIEMGLSLCLPPDTCSPSNSDRIGCQDFSGWLYRGVHLRPSKLSPRLLISEGRMSCSRIPKAEPDWNPNLLLSTQGTLHRPLVLYALRRTPVCTRVAEDGEQRITLIGFCVESYPQASEDDHSLI